MELGCDRWSSKMASDHFAPTSTRLPSPRSWADFRLTRCHFRSHPFGLAAFPFTLLGPGLHPPQKLEGERALRQLQGGAYEKPFPKLQAQEPPVCHEGGAQRRHSWVWQTHRVVVSNKLLLFRSTWLAVVMQQQRTGKASECPDGAHGGLTFRVFGSGQNGQAPGKTKPEARPAKLRALPDRDGMARRQKFPLPTPTPGTKTGGAPPGRTWRTERTAQVSAFGACWIPAWRCHRQPDQRPELAPASHHHTPESS